jgi:hypothetical protein
MEALMDVWWYGYSNELGWWILLVYPAGVALTCFVGWLMSREKKK